MRNQRDLVKASLERAYPRDVYPLRGITDVRPVSRKGDPDGPPFQYFRAGC
jgi:hypothetical protein